MIVNPCHNCDTRHKKCHARCAAYEAWRDERAREKADARRQNDCYISRPYLRYVRNAYRYTR